MLRVANQHHPHRRLRAEAERGAVKHIPAQEALGLEHAALRRVERGQQQRVDAHLVPFVGWRGEEEAVFAEEEIVGVAAVGDEELGVGGDGAGGGRDGVAVGGELYFALDGLLEGTRTWGKGGLRRRQSG